VKRKMLGMWCWWWPILVVLVVSFFSFKLRGEASERCLTFVNIKLSRMKWVFCYC
jgi:hypothetical protein